MWKIRGKNSSSLTNFESLTSWYVLQVGSTGLSHSHLLNLIWKKSFQLIIPNNKIKNWKIIIWDPQSTHADPKLRTRLITSTFSAQNLVNFFIYLSSPTKYYPFMSCVNFYKIFPLLKFSTSFFIFEKACNKKFSS